ncbi:alpha/beta hydrolase family protein [Litorimonas sp. WD9-15]|uniref:alpha/beta hydrolase family protein n=1 Tax=Litorimonas sp. WD9-15 TaxID=3418716 RepID=UPI003CFE856B
MFKFLRFAPIAILGGVLSLSPINAPGTSIQAHAATPNIDIYAQLPRTASVRISPDGKRIAMLAPYGADKAVFVYNLENPDAKTIIMLPPENSIVKSVSWASNKHVVTYARIRGKGTGKMKTFSTLYGRWLSYNIETEKSAILLDDRIKEKSYPVVNGGGYMHSLPNDPDNVLMLFREYAGKPLERHYRVNLDTGKESLDRNLPINTGATALSTDGETLLAREEYDDRSGRYKLFFGDVGNERVIYEKTFDTSKNRTEYFFAVVDGKALLQETERGGFSLFTIDPKTGARAPFRMNADVPRGYDYGPIFDPATDELIGVGYTDDTSRSIYSAEPYKSWHEKAKKALKGMEVSILSRTRDNSMVTIYAHSEGNAGEFYLMEPDKGQISSIGGMYPELAPSEIAKTIRADYTARDGLEIPAYLTLPPGKTTDSGPMPMVVMPHGGPTARDTADFDFWAQYLAAKGYVVFKPQFRGSTGFGYNFERAGYGEFGKGMLHDTVDGVNTLIEQNIADPDKICVTGASYGGYQALALPMIEPDMFQCALSVNGVSDIRDILKFEVARTGSNSGVIKFWRKIIGDRNSDKEMLIEQSPAENAEKIKAEIVLVHGTDDMTVPVQQSKTMAKALKKVGQSDDIILLENDDHNLSLPISRKKLLEASDELFGKHLD